MDSCRLCLGDSAHVDLFFQHRIPTLDKFMLYSRLKIHKNDGLSEKVCKDCAIKMEQTVVFIRRCIESDEKLRFKVAMKSFKSRNTILNDLLSFNVDDDYSVVTPKDEKKKQKMEEDKIDAEVTDDIPADYVDDESIASSSDVDNDNYFGDELTIEDKVNSILSRGMPEESGSLCNICGEQFGFGLTAQLEKHILTHGEKNFKCSTCSKAFYTKKSLNAHMTNHDESKSYPCEYCGKIFFKRARLMDHVKYTHLKTKKYPCEHCSKLFYRPDYFKKHLSVVHKIDQTYKCKSCYQTFPSLNLYQVHKRIHIGGPDFFCRICNTSYTTEKLLQEHEKVHSTNKPYLCPTCLKGFARKTFLKKHMEKVHCGAIFTDTMLNEGYS